MEKADIYGAQQKFDHFLEVASEKIPIKENRTAILDYCKDLKRRGIGVHRITKYASALQIVSGMLGKPFKKVGRKDLERWFDALDKRMGRSGKPITSESKRDYVVAIKLFYKWLFKTEQYPEQVAWMKAPKRNGNHLVAEQLLTDEDVKNIVRAASNPRDIAFVELLFESGCRIGELLSLQIKNLSFDEHGAVVVVDGKTGQRRVRVIASEKALKKWLERHPNRDNREAYLFINSAEGYSNEVWQYPAARKVLRQLFKKAKITKPSNPHFFRHSRASIFANQLTESQLKAYFGWTQSSDMAAQYVHLSGRDIDNALLKINGISVPSDQATENKFKLQECPRCHEQNDPAAIYCDRCTAPLTVEIALQQESTLAQLIKQVVREELKTPEGYATAEKRLLSTFRKENNNE